MEKKNTAVKRVFFTSIIFLLCITSSAWAMSEQELKIQGNLLADFLVVGRGTVAKSLAKYKINDASIGNKGFTPENFTAAINSGFKEKTGIDIKAGTSSDPLPGNTMGLLQALLDGSRQVCIDNQPVINMKGIGFKGFIPATYGRMVADIFRDKTGIIIKQTSTRFRNTYNAPDAFEKKILSEMEQPGYPKGQIVSQKDGGNYRVMKPIHIKKACLSCHGDPVGEVDVAGRKKEGYKEGDLRGAISVMIPAS